MGEKDDDLSVSVQSIDGPWTPVRSTTWGNDVVERRKKSRNWAWTWGLRNRWTAVKRKIEPAVQSSRRTIQPACSAIWTFARCHLWPCLVRVFKSKKQWFALLLFTFGAVAPMVMLGYFTPRSNYSNGAFPYYDVFAPKTMGCGSEFDDQPANSTVSGFEGLFVLDQTYGRFSFATAKTIDVAWDILFGRGVQMLAWWIAYVVFSDALLRVIERQPASFRIFQRIALEGPSLLSLWTLCTELLSSNSKRTKALFAYMLVSTTYVLCIPMFLGAMTGYDSTSIAWINLDDSNNIVPTSAVKLSWVITGTTNETFDKPFCADYDDMSKRSEYIRLRLDKCTCQRLDGSLAPPGTYSYYDYRGYLLKDDPAYDTGTQCFFDYPGANETFQQATYNDPQTGTWTKDTTSNCNDTVDLSINNKLYNIQTLNGSTAYCYDNKAYSGFDLLGKSRCLPDTANPSYGWGFSTMLSGVFVFIHFGWSASMWIVWLDAQARSVLVQGGYEMTPLRAAFAIAKAVKRKTGLGEKQLVRHDTKELDRELDGKGDQKGTKIDYGIFVPDAEEDAADERAVRRRRALALDGVPS
ncbi:hypothetical protein C7974DRAFT_222163 [Boeremia exigua]|uniref:uncharacterized protein n=1 Tax=Boeremia exigua TaxID=749465 RepID=UPI001E8DF461|nr:uncharacterized protein C7974DRAFT_222163 [Boeremia exigua]KAH6622435.1 hypothetical protein C7974DRAFT_222163 [Boeremia exigua]